MKARINRIVTGLSLGLVVFAAGISTAWATAIKTPFSGTSTHVVWFAQPALDVTPSGNARGTGFAHLWYDDADDDRLDGYDLVTGWVHIYKTGDLIAGGTFIILEKLDDIAAEDFATGNFELDEIIMGDILWEGTWTLGKDGIVSGVVRNPEGLIAFYTFSGSGDPNVLITNGHVLDPHGE